MHSRLGSASYSNHLSPKWLQTARQSLANAAIPQDEDLFILHVLMHQGTEKLK